MRGEGNGEMMSEMSVQLVTPGHYIHAFSGLYNAPFSLRSLDVCASAGCLSRDRRCSFNTAPDVQHTLSETVP